MRLRDCRAALAMTLGDNRKLATALVDAATGLPRCARNDIGGTIGSWRQRWSMWLLDCRAALAMTLGTIGSWRQCWSMLLRDCRAALAMTLGAIESWRPRWSMRLRDCHAALAMTLGDNRKLATTLVDAATGLPCCARNDIRGQSKDPGDQQERDGPVNSSLPDGGRAGFRWRRCGSGRFPVGPWCSGIPGFPAFG